MNNPPAPDDLSEINQLKKDLATMREQMAKLKAEIKKISYFFFIQAPDAEKGLPEKVMIRCTDLMIFHNRDQKREEQMQLTGTEEGPFLRLYGRDEKKRIELSAQNQGAQLELFSKDYAVAVQVSVEEPSSRGFVGIFDAGKPRAGLKAGTNGGIVTVSHDDGSPRATLASGAKTGELYLTNAETQAVTVALQTAQDGGGAIFVCDGSGTRQAIIASTAIGGQFMLCNDLGIQRVLLSSAQDSAALSLNWGGTDGVLLAAIDTGGTLVLNDASGNKAAELP